MSGPAWAFLTGFVLIWIVANGRASKAWEAITGVNTTPATPATPGTGRPLPPSSPYYPPNTG